MFLAVIAICFENAFSVGVFLNLNLLLKIQNYFCKTISAHK